MVLQRQFANTERVATVRALKLVAINTFMFGVRVRLLLRVPAVPCTPLVHLKVYKKITPPTPAPEIDNATGKVPSECKNPRATTLEPNQKN